MTNPYTLEDALVYTLELHHKNRLPHALIFTSHDLNLIKNSSQILAQYLLCQDPKNNTYQSCGTCHSCELFKADSHPDYLNFQGEGKTSSIKIDSIRDITSFLHQTPSVSHYRVVLIFKAEDLNQAAANALLKSLEEPGDNSLILLTTQDPHLLLPTIRSRAQVIHFESSKNLNNINNSNSYTNISSSNLSNLLAELEKDLNTPNFNPLALAQKYAGSSTGSNPNSGDQNNLNNPNNPLDKSLALVNGLYELIQIQIKNNLFNPPLCPSISSSGLSLPPGERRYQLTQALEFSDLCLNRKKALMQKIPLNNLLLAEDLLIEYQKVFKKPDDPWPNSCT